MNWKKLLVKGAFMISTVSLTALYSCNQAGNNAENDTNTMDTTTLGGDEAGTDMGTGTDMGGGADTGMGVGTDTTGMGTGTGTTEGTGTGTGTNGGTGTGTGTTGGTGTGSRP